MLDPAPTLASSSALAPALALGGVLGALALALVGALVAAGCGAATSSEAREGGLAGAPAPDGRVAERCAMVEEQLARRDVRDPRVLAALRTVPRHRFMPENVRGRAYRDSALPIGHGQTISQPYVVALMTEVLELDGTERVLEIGTGSGYQAAVLAELAAEVYTIEIVEPLAERARATFEELAYENVHTRTGDGYRGWPEAAPFDAIIVTAAPERIPQPLVDQLAVGGRMVIPVGDLNQELVLLRRTESGIEEERLIPVRFVPMTGTAAER